MSERDAADAARRAFGAIVDTAEQCRDNRRVRLVEDIGKDLVYASRLLLKSPGFTATAVLSLALGVGANTAIFGLVKQVILDLLPVRDPNQIVAITKTSIQLPGPSSSFSNPFLRDLQSSANLPFDGFLGFDRRDQIAMLVDSAAEPVSAEFVTGNYFELLGVHPALGRQFTPADDQAPDAQPVVVLSHNFWQRRFGADPSVLNRTIHLNNHPFTVIGVSARGFAGLDPGHSPDLRVTISMVSTLVEFPGPPPLSNRGSRWIEVFGRLKPGVSANRAAESLMPVLLQDHDLDPGRSRRTEYRAKVLASERLHVTPAAQGTGAQRHTYERAIWALGLMVAAVLLLACVNVAHLLLARASARAHEFSIRLAIGASRFRLVRQLLTESLLLGVFSGGAGLLVAYSLGRILVSLVISDREHSTVAVAPDAALLAFNFAVALAASIAFGLAPALQSSRSVLAPGLKGAHSYHVGRLMGRKVMISLQVAISLILLSGAGLFMRSLVNLRGIDLGFRTDKLLQVTLNPSTYAPERLPDFYNQLVEQVRSLPGVRAAAFGRQRLISNAAWKSGIVVPGFNPPEGDNGPSRDVIGSKYFSALGIPLIAGREFTDADTAAAPKVAIVNQAFAQFYFGSRNPLGMRIGPGGGKPDYTIVAVSRNAKYREMREATTRFWYVPFAQLGSDTSSFRALTLFVRTSSDPASMANSIRAAVGRVDKTIALFDIKTVDAQIGDNVRLERALATLSIFFGMVAALLAGAGLFGVLSYSVAQRKREIGIRIALGARPAQAAWTIVRGVAHFVLVGVAGGLAVTLSLSSLIHRLLFGIQPNDPLALSLAVLAMWVIAMLGVSIPASQAAKVEPASALRGD
ncbi:ABC transporter permease [Paludibaculum fermentans]|uniref:ABC transporter permease n=2 Tax=Paludibaculum fermentans TaxID=1473598 RepID=A0A7S7SIE4_PALFE|nr:ABC transporter permease [Paludibaculum fermentans]